MPLRHRAPYWGFLSTLLVCALVVPAAGQPRKKGGDKSEKADKTEAKAEVTESKKDGSKVKNFDFTGMDLSGRLRSPQLLYFLERANEELERASLEKRSFIPHMVRSVEEEKL